MPLCRLVSQLSTDNEDVCEEDLKCDSNFTLIECKPSRGFYNVQSSTQVFETNKPPNIEHELNVAKSLMQEGSSITGDNLFDHLADLIKRVLRDRPENLIDYFEEFSYNVREQKFRIAEQFPWFYYEPPELGEAKECFQLMKVTTEHEYDVCKKDTTSRTSITSAEADAIAEEEDLGHRKLLLNENVTRLHLYWMLCGFGLTTQEVQKLAYALKKIQFQPIVEHARFWGKMYGLKKSYYIAEVKLTRDEIEIRMEKMREEMVEKMCEFRNSSDRSVCTPEDEDLIPGLRWKDQPEEELKRMQPSAKPVPKPKVDIDFDIPPEAIGTGLNRRTYFVVNSLNEDWIELPIVTPKQIQVARQIKKLFTGDLETDIDSYPHFPGTEKHYLRAMIARITSGTYLAPEGYYRKLTKRERMEELGEEWEEEAEEEELVMEGEGEAEEKPIDNDAPITENSAYKPILNGMLLMPNCWVHVRPHILAQGRVVYFDEEAARKALEREAKLRNMGEEEAIEELEQEEGEYEGEEEHVIEEDDLPKPWIGPSLFSAASTDENDEEIHCWAPRYSSVQNKINQGVMMLSNIWPGAFSYAFEEYADSIYLGWGFKYTGRNMKVPQIPEIQEDYFPDDNEEILDPTVEMEEALRRYLEMKRLALEEFVEEVEDEEVC